MPGERQFAWVWRVTGTIKTKDQRMKKIDIYVSLDVHKDAISVAAAEGNRRHERARHTLDQPYPICGHP